MALARRTVVWLWLTAVGAVFVVVLAGLVAWYLLPKWAPDWVREHTPFVEPFVRATAVDHPYPIGTPASEDGFAGGFDVTAWSEEEMARMRSWGVDAIPVLERCLGERDPAIRFHAFRLLGLFDRPLRSQTQQLLKDADPWMRTYAWWRLTSQTRGPDVTERAREVVVDAGLDLLTDPDDYLRIDARLLLGGSFLHGRGQLLWDRRERLYECMRGSPGIRFCEEIFLGMLEDKFPEKEELPGEVLFPLLALARDFDGYPRYQINEVWLPRVHVDYQEIYEALSAMNRGECPWELGAQPWMYEHLHRLFTHRVSVSLKEAETKELTRACFPSGNVLISPQLIGPSFPSVTLDMQDRPEIELLLQLARILKAHLHLDHGVAKLVKWDDYHPGNRIIPTLPISVVTGVDPDHPTIKQLQRDLQVLRSFMGTDADLPRWFEEQGRQLGMVIDLQRIDWPDQFNELHFQDLPLAQILQFTAHARFLRLELDLSGVRVLPE